MNISALWAWGTDALAAAGVENPRFTAELLLREALGWSRVQLLTRGEATVLEECEERYRDFIRRRSLGIATQYITGRQEFYGRDFSVTPDVLIPRPETELLVAVVMAYLSCRPGGPSMLDLGTGSGCIGLTLAAEVPSAMVTLSDCSLDALKVARQNADRLKLRDNVTFVHGDLFSPLEGMIFDVVVSNPPYIPEGDCETLAAEVLGEPSGALFAGVDGLAVYRRIAAEGSHYLSSGGLLALEIGHGQATTVSRLLLDGGFTQVNLHRDLADRERVLTAVLP